MDRGIRLIAKLQRAMSFSLRLGRRAAPRLLFANFCIIALLSHTRTIDRPFSALESLPPQTLISSISAAR
jgi:hypothetical protein